MLYFPHPPSLLCPKHRQLLYPLSIAVRSVFITTTSLLLLTITLFIAKECKWFNSPGGCWYGGNCKFKHTPAETLSPLRLASQSQGMPSEPASPTASEAQEAQRQLHYKSTLDYAVTSLFALAHLDLWQTARLCPQFLCGTCSKGDQCNYIHPAGVSLEDDILGAYQATSPPRFASPPSVTGSMQRIDTHAALMHATQPGVAFMPPLLPHARLPSAVTPQLLPPISLHARRRGYNTLDRTLDALSSGRSLLSSISTLPSPSLSPTTSMTSSSVSGSPTSTLVASPPRNFFNRKDEMIPEDEVDAVIGGGMRFGAIGTPPRDLKLGQMRRVYYLDDDEDDADEVIVYQRAYQFLETDIDTILRASL